MERARGVGGSGTRDQSGAIATRDLHIVTFARYDDGYRAMRDKEPARHRLAVQVLP